MRPLCSCGCRPVAINYIKNKRTYYRKVCEACRAKKPMICRWYKAGYRVKMQCDKCGFKSPYVEVFTVFHIDGNLNNCRPSNLKTICANCQRILHREGVIWKQGDLRPDF